MKGLNTSPNLYNNAFPLQPHHLIKLEPSPYETCQGFIFFLNELNEKPLPWDYNIKHKNVPFLQKKQPPKHPFTYVYKIYQCYICLI